MKKGMVLVLAAAVMTITSAAYAQEKEQNKAVKLSGDFNYKYEQSKPDDSEKAAVGEATFRLKAEAELEKGWSLFARYGYRNFSIDSEDATLSKLDQYGFTYKKGEAFTGTFGVQEVILGPFGTLIDLTDNVGDGMLTGVSAAGKAGATDYLVFVGKLDKQLFDSAKKQAAYGLELKQDFGGVTGLVEYLHMNNADEAYANNYYGVGLSREQGKAEFLAEYVRSSASDNKYGTIFGVNYQATDKDVLGLTYRNIKGNATPAVDGIFGYNDEKGPVLSWERSMGKAGSFVAEYDINKTPSSGEKVKTLTLEYNYSF